MSDFIMTTFMVVFAGCGIVLMIAGTVFLMRIMFS